MSLWEEIGVLESQGSATSGQRHTQHAQTAKHPPPRSFIHVSDLCADASHPSRRMRSKAAGDAAVMEALPGLATIMRPAPVVGDEDDFLNNLLMQVGGCVPGVRVPARKAAQQAVSVP